MSEWEHLPKAPITEALIDIRVQLPQGTDIQSLSPFRDEVRGDYPTCRERRKGHAELVFSEKGLQKLQAETAEIVDQLPTKTNQLQSVLISYTMNSITNTNGT